MGNLRDKVLKDAERSLVEMMDAAMVFHGEPGWHLYSTGAPEWKRAQAALAALRALDAAPVEPAEPGATQAACGSGTPGCPGVVCYVDPGIFGCSVCGLRAAAPVEGSEPKSPGVRPLLGALPGLLTEEELDAAAPELGPHRAVQNQNAAVKELAQPGCGIRVAG